MTTPTPTRLAAALILSLGLGLAATVSPAARAQEAGTDHSAHAGHAMPAAPDGPAAQAFAAASAKMHADMAIPLTGDADVDFMQGMIPHHQGAIDMARIVLEHGTDPEVRKLAEAVIAAQEAEITFMKEWLARKQAQ